MVLSSEKKEKFGRSEVGHFYFKNFKDKFLISNDFGYYSFLTQENFNDFLYGRIKNINRKKFLELRDKGFIRNQCDLNALTERYASRNQFLGQGTSLHIVVVTLRCDHACVYCQSGSKPVHEKKWDMDAKTAQKVVERIFESPSQYLSIEFQGGEPLLNWPVVRLIVEEALKKNKTKKKNLLFSLVSNFTYLDEKKLKFILDNKITLCTSFDGPEQLHILNRRAPFSENNYKNTIYWISKVRRKIRERSDYPYKINGLTTVTQASLSYPKEIINEFVRQGLGSIFLRPVSPYGLSRELWASVGYDAQKFIKFYEDALDYILELNKKGMRFTEKTAVIFLTKILTDKDPNFLDLRSPCGAGTGQLAYHCDGSVYLCDEGRMLAAQGDESFRVGDVTTGTWSDFIRHDATHAVSVASHLDNIPRCYECVYKPYCGVCPLYNYVMQGSLFDSNPHNEKCRIHEGILNYLFKKLEHKKNKEVFLSWLKN